MVLRSELRPFRLPLRVPMKSGGVWVRFRAGLLVGLSDGEHAGWGEGSPLPGWSTTTTAQTSDALHRARNKIDAEGESSLPAVLESLADKPHARAAVSGAWNDLQARRSEHTLTAHLLAEADGFPSAGADGCSSVESDGFPSNGIDGFPSVGVDGCSSVEADGCWSVESDGFPSDGVDGFPMFGAGAAVNALVTASGAAEVEEQADAALRAGFDVIKLKAGAANTTSDIDRVRAARHALGPEPELRLDANGAWDHATAVDVLRRVEPCRIAFCEEPVSGLSAIAAVARAVGVPVAVDESASSQADVMTAIRLGVPTIIVKPQAWGGPDTALKIASRAIEAGVTVVVTSFIDSAIGIAHALHIAVSVDALQDRSRPGSRHMAHGLATSHLLAADLAEPPKIKAGFMQLPVKSGLGVTPDQHN